MESMKLISEHLSNRPQQLAKLRDQGIKIIGYFPGDYVPEEIIYASGAVPLCLSHGGDPEAVVAAQPVTMRFQCAFSKAQLGERLLGKQPYYNLVDLLVAPITCSHLRKTADLWQYHSHIDVFRLGIPREYNTEYGLQYYLGSLQRLKQRIETLTGNEINDDKLREAISLYNTMRELLKKISFTRRASQPSISGLDFLRLNHASFYADPAFLVDMLRAVLMEIRENPHEAVSQGKPRLLLIGPNIAYGDYKILELVKEAGGLVVAEEVCEGVRYYWENVEENHDPLTALADRYLGKRLPCAFMNASSKKRLDFMLNLVREFNAEGIIWYQLLYCETYDIESYFFEKKLQEVGMPMLKLQSDYDAVEMGPLKTRIEAFIEMITRKGES